MLQTRYITPEELMEYSGIDFEAKLKDDANPSNKVASFIFRWEVRLEAYLNARFFKKVTDEWPQFTDWQKQMYKYALMEQCMYVFRNGDLSTDSGYDPEKGEVIDIEKLKKLVIAPNAVEFLELTGLWNRHIQAPGFFTGGGWLWGV